MAVKKLAPVGAHYGLWDWLVQRISAVVMVVCAVVIVISWGVIKPVGYEQWQAFIGLTGIRLALLMMVLSMVWHAFIGARDIYMDYIKHDGLRLLKQVLMSVYLLVCFLWAMLILL